MPIGDPSIIFSQTLKTATKQPAFASLSPTSQAALLQVAAYPPGSALRQAALANNPALQAAIKEGQEKGIIDDTPLWKAVLKGTAIAGGVAAAGPAIGALTGGGAPAAGGGGSIATSTSAADAAAAGVLPSAGSIGVSALPAGGVGLGTAASIAPAVIKTATTGSSLLHDLLPSIIGAGSSVGGAAIAANANTEAAKIQAETAAKALAVQQQQYALQRQDTAPYRALGQGAVNNLGYLGGIDTTSNLAALSSTAPVIPSGTNPSENIAPVVALGAKDASGQPIPSAGMNQTIPRPPTPAQQGLGTLSQPISSGTVRIQDPATGLVHLIPQTQAAAAQSAGGRLV